MSRSRSTVAQLERAALADALLAAGRDAPTLCEGWTALDLAAHVVIRERRPDSLPGLVVPPLGGWTEAVLRRERRHGLPALAMAIRSGPPWWSPFALPGVDENGNLMEMLIHHEDVRRGRGAGPREAGVTLDAVEEAVWRSMASAQGRMRLLRAGTGVVLRRTPRGVDPGSPGVGLGEVVARRARRGQPTVTISGAPIELALYAFGRRGAARVALIGPEEGIRRITGAKLRA